MKCPKCGREGYLVWKYKRPTLQRLWWCMFMGIDPKEWAYKQLYMKHKEKPKWCYLGKKYEYLVPQNCQGTGGGNEMS